MWRHTICLFYVAFLITGTWSYSSLSKNPFVLSLHPLCERNPACHSLKNWPHSFTTRRNRTTLITLYAWFRSPIPRYFEQLLWEPFHLNIITKIYTTRFSGTCSLCHICCKNSYSAFFATVDPVHTSTGMPSAPGALLSIRCCTAIAKLWHSGPNRTTRTIYKESIKEEDGCAEHPQERTKKEKAAIQRQEWRSWYPQG